MPLLISLGLFTAAAMGFTPFYLVNDDLFALFIAKGVVIGLAPDEHLFCNHFLLGFLLKGLYTQFPNTPWYPLLLGGTGFLACWTFLEALRAGPYHRFKFVLYCVLFLYAGLYFFIFMNYTALSLLVAMAGLLLWAAPTPKGSPYLVALCLVLSFLWRFEATVLAVILTLPTLLPVLRKVLERDRPLFPVLALTGALLALFLLDFGYYRMDKEWRSVPAFIYSMQRCHDHRAAAYDETTGPTFAEVGWSKNDSDLFNSWYFMDKDRYSTEVLQKLSHALPFPGQYPELFRYNLLRLLRLDTTQDLALCLLVFLLFLPRPKWGPFLLQSAWVTVILLALVYFAKAPTRIYLPALFLLVFLAIQRSVPGRTKKGPPPFSLNLGWAGLILLLLIAFPVVHQYRGYNQVQLSGEGTLKKAMGALAPRPDQLFVIWGSLFPYENIRAFDDLGSYRDLKAISFCSFERTPIAQKMLDRFGIKDLFPDMVDRPDVFLLCNQEAGVMYYRYMMEKFKMAIYPEGTFQGPGFRVYRIHSRRDYGKASGTSKTPDRREVSTGQGR